MENGWVRKILKKLGGKERTECKDGSNVLKKKEVLETKGSCRTKILCRG